jgi:hypothetical protein
VAAAEDSQGARERFLAVAAAMEAAEAEGGSALDGCGGVGGVGAPAYYVSKPWLG